MGIAMPAFSTLPALLRALTRWFQQAVHLEPGMPESSAPAGPSADPLRGNTFPGRHYGTAENTAATPQHHPSVPSPHRPLRGNWPFKVRPPAPAPAAPIRPSKAAARSFVSASTSMGSRDAFFASLATDRHRHRSARVLRRVYDAGTGRLVIAGRMADVCAELDRMAASEGLQAP